MNGLLLDTHAAIWYLSASPRLSQVARSRVRQAIADGLIAFVPAICLVEIVYLVEKGRLPVSSLERLGACLGSAESSFQVVALDAAIAQAVSRISREQVPDMPDRIIAATALHLELPLVSADRRIRASGIDVIW